MGRLLKARGLNPDGVVSSPAVRARSTARAIADVLDFPAHRILLREEIYERGMAGIIDVIHSLPPAWGRVILVGHNPDLTLLIGRLADADIEHLPTCGVASIEFPAVAWEHIMEGSGRLTWYDYPKRHPLQH